MKRERGDKGYKCVKREGINGKSIDQEWFYSPVFLYLSRLMGKGGTVTQGRR